MMRCVLALPLLLLLTGCEAAAREKPTPTHPPAGTASAAATTAPDHLQTPLQLQAACMAYVAPADLVVYSEETEFVKNHVRGVGGYRLMHISAPTPKAYNCDIVFMPVKPWDDYAAASGGMEARGLASPPLVLVHALKAPDGKRFLATLEMPPWYGETLVFVSRMRELEAQAGEAPMMHEQVINVPIAFVPVLEQKGLRFYGAQFAEKDPSSFTIAYAVDGVRGTLRGSMEKEVPQVRIEVVDGPLKKR